MKTYFAVCLLALLWACSDAVVSPPLLDDPPPASQTVSVTFCDAVAPLWMGFQDGDGAWTRVEPAHEGGKRVFQLAFASNRGGVATVFQNTPGATFLQVLYGIPEELAGAGINSPRFCGPAATQTLFGSVAGIGSADLAIVRGGFNSVAQAHVGEDFKLDYLPPGPKDVLAARETFEAGEGPRLTQFILRRGVDLPDNASLPVLDFDAPEAFAPVLPNVTIEGIGQDGAFVLSCAPATPRITSRSPSPEPRGRCRRTTHCRSPSSRRGTCRSSWLRHTAARPTPAAACSCTFVRPSIVRSPSAQT